MCCIDLSSGAGVLPVAPEDLFLRVGPEIVLFKVKIVVSKLTLWGQFWPYSGKNSGVRNDPIVSILTPKKGARGNFPSKMRFVRQIAYLANVFDIDWGQK